MSTIRPTSDPKRAVDKPPEFDLSHRFDDPEDPTEMTVFPESMGESTTQWLSIETGYVLPVEEIR